MKTALLAGVAVPMPLAAPAGKAPAPTVTLLDTQLVTKKNPAAARGWDTAR